MSFADIARLPQEQQDAVIGEMTDEQINAFGDFYVDIGKAAKQEADRAAIRAQAAIEDGKRLDAARQVAINGVIQKVPQIIPVCEQKIIAGQRLTIEQKEVLIYILSIKKPPEWMPRVQKLLENPQNFAGSASK